jgi:hypothetical protein
VAEVDRPLHILEMLVPFGTRIWLAEGPVVRFAGAFPYSTRMAVAQLEDGSLWVWSTIPLDETLAAELEAIGPVRHLVAPNKLHHLFLGEWAERFPEARLHAAPGLAKKRSDLSFASELGDAPDPAWDGELDQVVFRGSFFMDEVVFHHRSSRTVLVTDLVQRFERDQLTGLAGRVMRLWGIVGERGSTPREWRASFWNRRAARAARETALGWNPEKLVIAHGTCAPENGREVLATGLHWLD